MAGPKTPNFGKIWNFFLRNAIKHYLLEYPKVRKKLGSPNTFNEYHKRLMISKQLNEWHPRTGPAKLDFSTFWSSILYSSTIIKMLLVKPKNSPRAFLELTNRWKYPGSTKLKILISAEIEVSVRGWWHTSILRILRTLLKNFELSWGKALLWIICLISKKVINDYCYNENDKTNGIPWFKHNLISEIRHIWGGWGWAPISTRFPVRTTKLQLQVGTKSSSIKS